MIPVYSRDESIEKINLWGSTNCPFYFIISFDQEKNILLTRKEYEDSGIKFSFENKGVRKGGTVDLNFIPPSYSSYCKAFLNVMSNIRMGNSFLVNLTFPSRIKVNLSLEEIYDLSGARYKLLVPDQFVVFSPETFVKIRNNRIFSFSDFRINSSA